jgi:hypothetical protein
MRNPYKILDENLKKKDCLENLRVNRSIILEWILKGQCAKVWAGFIWLTTAVSGGLF